MPARAAAYLAAKFVDARATPAALTEAEDPDWEVLIAREVDDLLVQGADVPDPRQAARAALKLMEGRTRWSPGSPLYRLKAEALELLGEAEAAERAVHAGISAIEDQRAPATSEVSSTLMDLLVMGARFVRARGGSPATADRQLDQAERLATRLGRGAEVLDTLLYRLHLQRTSAEELEGAGAVRRRAAQRFLQLGDDELRRQPELARAMAEELGAEDADVLNRAIDVLGLSAADGDALSALAARAAALAASDEPVARSLVELARRHGVPVAGTPPTGAEVRSVLERLAAVGRLGDVAKVLVTRSRDGSDVRAQVVDLLPGVAGSRWRS